jgi:SNF2 family DNA or RNA helicase
MKLTLKCAKCGKPAKIQSEFPMGKLIGYVWMCGHMEVREKISFEVSSDKEESRQSASEYVEAINLKSIVNEPRDIKTSLSEEYISLDAWVTDGGLVKGISSNPSVDYGNFDPRFQSWDNNLAAYEFQREGIKFAEDTQLNCLIADAMGLGKTIQGILAMWRNKQIALPCVVLVPSSTIFQWADQISKWASKDFITCVPVTSRAQLIPGFGFYILSMDMISKKDIREKLLACGIKSVIVDEVQNFKDPSAKRTKGLIEFIELAGIKYKIALSGTPIKNRASEYFTILNLLAPQYFNSLDNFKKKWLLPETKMNSSGNAVTTYQRLNPLVADKFKTLISTWVIRRERHDVLKNLPALTRDFQIIEIDDPNIKNTYNRTIDLFANWLRDNKSGADSSQMLGWLAQLRAITGVAKCKNAIEWILDFCESTDESLSVGIHHKSVREILFQTLQKAGIKSLELSGEDNVYGKADVVRRFTNGAARVLVVNTKAGGVGLNLQTCAQALVLERQWNSADEEQFECRFHRDGQKSAVTVTYMIAKGTIDEFFHTMVTNKRKILLETGMGNEVDLTTDLNFLQELCENVVNNKI